MIDRRSTLALIGSMPLVSMSGAAGARPAAPELPAARDRIALDDGWKFHLGDANDLDKDFGFGANLRTYAKQGYPGVAPASPDFADMQWGKSNFNDSDWTDIVLPHDWAVGLPYTPNASFKPTKPDDGDPRNGHGFKPLGREYPATSIGWYRRKFRLGAEDAGKRLSLEFDGIFRDALIMVNGYLLARNDSGYAPFRLDITDVANFEEPNLICIRVDATLGEGWFYEGAGIYRRVHLVKTPALHVPQWGVTVRGRADGTVDTLTEVRLDGDTPAEVTLVNTVLDPSGKAVATGQFRPTQIAAWSEVTLPQSLKVPAPMLWDLNSPNLYVLRTTLIVAGQAVDQVDTRFGLRDLRFDADRGFFLNGRSVKLRGANLHQDHAGVGIAVTKPLNRFRLEQMRAMGCNAIRCSHNPQSAEFMDLCDEMGMLVLAENRQMSSSDEGIGQFERLVRRDRNRPSVILWSVGNEEPQEGSVRGARIVRSQMREMRRLDPTRLYGAAFDNSFTKPTGTAPEFDFIGVNYNPSELAKVHAAFPRKIVVATETGSSVATRGVYFRNEVRRHLPAYDNQKVPWGQQVYEWLPEVETESWIAGGFVWTGLDYHGEPSPFYTYPSVGSQFGIYDICGFPKDVAYYLRACWRPEPLLHLFPHWNWAGREGEPIDVWCFTNLDEVELLLNGHSLGRKAVARFGHAEWKVPFAPGTIEARAYRGGKVVLRERRTTTGAPVALKLTTERSRLAGDGQDTAIVVVSALDSAGRAVPDAETRLRFDFTGPVWLAGTGNGDPSSLEPEQEKRVRLFSGLCQILLRTSPGQSGTARLTVTADGLRSASQTFTVA